MSWISGGTVFSVVVLAACGGAAVSTSEPEASPVVDAASPAVPATPAPAPAPGTPPTADPSGFPCEVSAFLQLYCAACHTGNYPPSYYYVPTFKSREDLLRADGFGQTLGQALVLRMTNSYQPMPPANAALQPSPDEVAIVSRWVDDGMPSGTCGPLGP